MLPAYVYVYETFTFIFQNEFSSVRVFDGTRNENFRKRWIMIIINTRKRVVVVVYVVIVVVAVVVSLR